MPHQKKASKQTNKTQMLIHLSSQGRTQATCMSCRRANHCTADAPVTATTREEQLQSLVALYTE